MSACRDRKGLASFTAKLTRMVGNVKRKRKALAAQHASAPSPPPPFTPFFCFFPSHTNSSPTQSNIPQFTSHSRSRSHSPLHPTRNSTPQTANSSPILTHKTPCSAPVSPPRIPHIDPHSKKTQPSSASLHANPSFLSASVATSCRKQTGYGIFWAVVLLAMLYAFLCMGKEISCVVATVAHLILQIVERLGLLNAPDNSVEKDNTVGWIDGHTRPLNRSATVPHSCRLTVSISTQCNRRSKSWTPSIEVGKVVGSGPATESQLGGGNLCGGMKLQLMLLVSICGLFYGRFLAICMAVCCIFICSKMERLCGKR